MGPISILIPNRAKVQLSPNLQWSRLTVFIYENITGDWLMKVNAFHLWSSAQTKLVHVWYVHEPQRVSSLFVITFFVGQVNANYSSKRREEVPVTTKGNRWEKIVTVNKSIPPPPTPQLRTANKFLQFPNQEKLKRCT